MNTELIGMISGGIVIISAIPYSIRTYQGKIKPNITSWSLWTLIGLALLLTYKSSGAEANVWPALFGFTNPLIITILAIKRKGEWTKLNIVERICLVVGLISFGMWLGMRESKSLVQYALYVAIIADACAAIPTILFVWTHPDGDRPFAWGLFSVGYALAIFAITDHTFANYALPVYMSVGSLSITTPLCLYRIKKRIPLKEWV